MISLLGVGALSPIVVVLLWFDLGTFLWVLVGGLVCFIYMAFYTVFPARMTITTRGEGLSPCGRGMVWQPRSRPVRPLRAKGIPGTVTQRLRTYDRC
jgi:hypothetical protein